MTAAQRTTIAGALADFLKDAPVIAKEQHNILSTRPDVATYFAKQDPAAKLQQMQAAFDKLVTTLGSSSMDDAVRLMNAATAGLNSLSAWAEKNPGMARALTDAAAGLGAVATGLGALSTATFLFQPALQALLGERAAVEAASAAAAGRGGLLGAASRSLMGAGGAAGLAAAAGIGLAIHEEDQYSPGSAAAHQLVQGVQAQRRHFMAPHYATPEEAARHVWMAPPMTVQLHGDVTMDGAKVGKLTASGLAKSGSGPLRGTTSYDPSMNVVGSMNGATQ